MNSSEPLTSDRKPWRQIRSCSRFGSAQSQVAIAADGRHHLGSLLVGAHAGDVQNDTLVRADPSLRQQPLHQFVHTAVDATRAGEQAARVGIEQLFGIGDLDHHIGRRRARPASHVHHTSPAGAQLAPFTDGNRDITVEDVRKKPDRRTRCETDGPAGHLRGPLHTPTERIRCMPETKHPRPRGPGAFRTTS
jgi:hypothetical protein